MRILILTFALSLIAQAQDSARLEDTRGKTVMLFTPHPDDDTFCCAWTLTNWPKTATASTS